MEIKPAQRIAQVKPYFFADLDKTIASLKKSGMDVIRLDIGSPDLPPADFIITALNEAAKLPDMHGYGQSGGSASLRKAFSLYYKNRFNLDLDPDKEILGLIGSKEGLFNLSQVLLDPGDLALIPDPYYPVYDVSWYEAAQFVNWLNTSNGYHAAYKFTGTQGTSNYTFDTWDTSEAAGGTNLYRHKNAFYFLPTEDEWVKAAYWNGTSLQTYATKPGDTLHQGNGTNGTGWNYYVNGFATNPPGPWNVGSGSAELYGTYDMMGNVYEWLESPSSDTSYGAESNRGVRGGAHNNYANALSSYSRHNNTPVTESETIGFRVASVPEPASGGLLLLAGLAFLKRQRPA